MGLNPAVGLVGVDISCYMHARKESRRQRRTPHRRRGQSMWGLLEHLVVVRTAMRRRRRKLLRMY